MKHRSKKREEEREDVREGDAREKEKKGRTVIEREGSEGRKYRDESR